LKLDPPIKTFALSGAPMETVGVVVVPPEVVPPLVLPDVPPPDVVLPAPVLTEAEPPPPLEQAAKAKRQMEDRRREALFGVPMTLPVFVQGSWKFPAHARTLQKTNQKNLCRQRKPVIAS
jgi:hypothetical protein